jgi:hypothetical protein
MEDARQQTYIHSPLHSVTWYTVAYVCVSAVARPVLYVLRITIDTKYVTAICMCINMLRYAVAALCPRARRTYGTASAGRRIDIAGS